MTSDSRDLPPARRRPAGTGRKLAASAATVLVAAGVVALPTVGAFTDEQVRFTESVLAPPSVEDLPRG